MSERAACFERKGPNTSRCKEHDVSCANIRYHSIKFFSNPITWDNGFDVKTVMHEINLWVADSYVVVFHRRIVSKCRFCDRCVRNRKGYSLCSI